MGRQHRSEDFSQVCRLACNLVTVNLQVDGIWNHLGNTLLVKSERLFPEMSWGGRPTLSVGGTFQQGGPDKKKCLPASISSCVSLLLLSLPPSTDFKLQLPAWTEYQQLSSNLLGQPRRLGLWRHLILWTKLLGSQPVRHTDGHRGAP